MAQDQGYYIVRGTISSNTDTAVVASAGVTKQIHILWITLTTSVAGTTSRLIVQAGAGGSTILRMPTVTADALVNINYNGADKNWMGNPIGVNTALSINTTGGAAATVDYEVAYRVRG